GGRRRREVDAHRAAARACKGTTSMIHPSLAEFSAVARPGALVPVFREILADLETPVSAYMKIAQGQEHAFLLESVEQAGTLGRYSFIGANPSVIFQSKGNTVTITRGGAAETF